MIRAAIIAFGLLAGCVAPGGMPDTPEYRAKAVIGASLVGTAPQNLMPRIATCAFESATPDEVERLQATIDMAPNAVTQRISRNIIQRDATQACLAANGITMVKG